MIDLPEGSSVEATDAVAEAVARASLAMPEVVAVETHAGTAAPFDFNGLVRHAYLRAEPQLGDVQLQLTPKGERARSSHAVALELRRAIAAVPAPAGTSLKVVEPPPGPPVMATLLAEIYGPDADVRRRTAEKVEAAFRAVPFVVDVDNSFGTPARRLRASISTDDLEYFHVEESDVFDTLAILNGTSTVGYSHRGGGRAAIPIVLERAPRATGGSTSGRSPPRSRPTCCRATGAWSKSATSSGSPRSERPSPSSATTAVSPKW